MKDVFGFELINDKKSQGRYECVFLSDTNY